MKVEFLLRRLSVVGCCLKATGSGDRSLAVVELNLASVRVRTSVQISYWINF